MTVSGTLAHLNAALNGLTFTPAAGYVGAASLGVSLENMGNGLTGSGGVGLTVNAVTPVAPARCRPMRPTDSGEAGFDVDWAGLVGRRRANSTS